MWSGRNPDSRSAPDANSLNHYAETSRCAPDFDSLNQYGETAPRMPAALHHTDVVALLMLNGANPQIEQIHKWSKSTIGANPQRKQIHNGLLTLASVQGVDSPYSLVPLKIRRYPLPPRVRLVLTAYDCSYRV